MQHPAHSILPEHAHRASTDTADPATHSNMYLVQPVDVHQVLCIEHVIQLAGFLNLRTALCGAEDTAATCYTLHCLQQE